MAQAKQQMESAADQYAALKQKRFDDWLATTFTAEALDGVPLFEVKVPSGMRFKCRKVSKEYLGNAGQIPMALSAQVASAFDEGQAPTEADALQKFAQMSHQERVAAMRASAQMVRYCAVEPRLVFEVNGHRNAINVDDLTMEDFGALAKWAQGGDAAEGLKTFRRKRK